MCNYMLLLSSSFLSHWIEMSYRNQNTNKILKRKGKKKEEKYGVSVKMIEWLRKIQLYIIFVDNGNGCDATRQMCTPS